jgi:hypothetical protein
MHFKTSALSFPLDGAEKFLREAGAQNDPAVYAHRQEIEISKNNLKSFPRILVLDYE